MSANKTVARVGVAAIAFGLVVGPQAVGIAAADTPDAGSATSTPGQSKASGTHRGARTAKSDAAPAAASRATRSAAPAAASAPSANRRAAVASAPAELPASVAAALTGTGPSASQSLAAPPTPLPTDTTSTAYGNLGKWMINKDTAIANWLGKPQPVNVTTGTGTCPTCTPKTILEGINVVFVDTASTSTNQAVRNLNAWVRQSGFGASAISSTGYGGYFGGPTPNLYSQQPTGANQAFRNSFFLFANSHARVFGPYPNQNGPGYVWTSSFSEENWSPKNPLTHGYQSFLQAQQEVTTGMLSINATNLGPINMENKYNVGDVSTGDATGYAQVLGLNKLLKAATTARGAVKTTIG